VWRATADNSTEGYHCIMPATAGKGIGCKRQLKRTGYPGECNVGLRDAIPILGI
jgi:hypothetical protein